MSKLSNLTNFEKVVEFNSTFGVQVHSRPQCDIFSKNKALVKLRMDLIREEVAELEQAVRDGDMVETIDALSDILYVVYGMGASLGINLDEAFDIVHASNMSKVCKDEDEAQKTVAYYLDNVKTLGYDTPCYRKTADGKYYVVYNKNTGKVLKSINYTPAKLSDLVVL